MYTNAGSSRAADLFSLIRAKGIKAIEDFISERKSEELFLDFKRSSDNGKGDHLSDIDRNNFAKAVCGFANSEGGIIIWGVDCSKNKDGADVANSSFLIEDVDKFESLLQGAVSGITIPPVIGVQNFKIKSKSKAGYVISYVPKSSNTPHQAIYNSKFYIRAGSNFVDTPYSVLASMFGKRPQPYVFIQYTVGSPSFEEDRINIQIGLMFRNQGSVVAKDSFINVLVYDTKTAQIAFKLLDDNWNGSFSFGRFMSVMSKEGVRIAPESHVQPIQFNILLNPPFENDLDVRLNCGCEGSPIMRSKLFCKKEDIERIYTKYFNKYKNEGFKGLEANNIFEELFPKDDRERS